MTPVFAALALMLCSAQALVPQQLNARAATCNRDNCYRDVFGTVTPGRSAQGVKDCTSYLQKTVTPCPITSTTTVITTKAGSTITITSTVTSTGPAVGATITSTATSTSTVTPMTTITSTETETDTLLTDTTTTLTATSYTNPYLKKRDVIEARATAASCPVTNSATGTVPAYASDCTGTRFSSVCSCNGNVPTTATTVPASTTKATVTSTALTSATTTATSTVLVTPTNTVTSTVTTTVTVTAPASTSTETATATTTITSFTTTRTATTTVTAPQPTCNAAQEAACNSNVCGIDVTGGQAICYDTYQNQGSCTSDSQCTNPGVPYCVYDNLDLVTGTQICVNSV